MNLLKLVKKVTSYLGQIIYPINALQVQSQNKYDREHISITINKQNQKWPKQFSKNEVLLLPVDKEKLILTYILHLPPKGRSSISHYDNFQLPMLDN